MKDFQKIKGLHGLNHEIIEYSKKEKVITDKRTDRQTHTQTVETPKTKNNLTHLLGKAWFNNISLFVTDIGNLGIQSFNKF